MVDPITLSAAAVDVLGEQLNLDVRQYPFELPRADEHGRSPQQVAAELEAAGLAGGNGPEPEVEDALYLLCGSEVSVAAAGLLDVRTGRRLAARVVATGEVGVAGVLDESGLRLDFLDPEDLPAACADLLPQAPAAAGEPVRAERSGGSVRGGAELAELTGRPKFRLGHFLITGTERRSRRAAPPGLTWFDNDLGRFTLVGEALPDGTEALTCAPADRAAIIEGVAGMLGRV